ncbi:hypothetical protein BJ741DRAFT_594153 [Chytriomyces cf. hyalinus JEL632]|nr:hypothetical protein BJ741DRAFT_594153 [Chytriomyces cf. hyalinus JEL632]
MNKPDGIVCTLHGGVKVVELTHAGHSVMRRLSSNLSVNGTHILLLAGVIDKVRRSRILDEKCISLGWPHEKVQGGSGRFQGTWMGTKHALELAAEFNVQEIVQQLVDYVPAPDAQFVPHSTSSTPLNLSPQLPSRRGLKRKADAESPQTKKMIIANLSEEEADDVDSDDMMSSEEDREVFAPPNPKKPADTKDSIQAASHEYLISLFLPQKLTSTDPIPSSVDVSMPIDSKGNTAIHWAASLGHVETLRKLLAANSTNPDSADSNTKKLLLNFALETPLMSAMRLANNYARQSFRSILELLGTESLSAKDCTNQTLLHHAAALAGSSSSGKSACIYYVSTLAQVLKDSNVSAAPWVDRRDWNGETAVDIIRKRVSGCESVLNALRALGADVDSSIERFKVRDGSIKIQQIETEIDVASQQILGSIAEKSKTDGPIQIPESQKRTTITAGNPNFVRHANDAQTAATAMLNQLSDIYNEALASKIAAIQEHENQIASRQIEISNLRKQNKDLRSQNVNISELAHRIGALEKSYSEERKILSSVPLGNADFKLASEFGAGVSEAGVESLKAQEAELMAEMEKEREIGQQLQKEKLALRAHGDPKYSENVAIMRKIISFAIEVPMNDIDAYLDPFLVAMEDGKSL